MFEILHGGDGVFEGASHRSLEFLDCRTGCRTIEFDVLDGLADLGFAGGQDINDSCFLVAMGADDGVKHSLHLEPLRLDGVADGVDQEWSIVGDDLDDGPGEAVTPLVWGRVEDADRNRVGGPPVQELEQPRDLGGHRNRRQRRRPLVGEPAQVGAPEVGESFGFRLAGLCLELLDYVLDVWNGFPGHGEHHDTAMRGLIRCIGGTVGWSV